MRSSIAGRRSLVSSPVRWSAASMESLDPQKKAEDGRRVRKWVKEADFASLVAALNDDPQLWLNEPDDNGYEPLHWAVLKANLPMVKLLVARGANLEGIEHGDGSTPLMLAVRMEHPQVSSVLIDGRANVHTTDRYNKCLLRWAADQPAPHAAATAGGAREGRRGAVNVGRAGAPDRAEQRAHLAARTRWRRQRGDAHRPARRTRRVGTPCHYHASG